MNNAAKMYRPLYEADPQIAAAIDNETRRQHEGLELIASENFVSEAVLEADGLGVHQQICRGLSGQALLRRLRVRRRGREPGARSREATLRRGACERAAARRIAGQHGGLCGDAAAGRHDSRAEPRAWRTSDARASPEFFRQDLQDRSLRRHQRNRNHRLRRAGEARGEGTSQADHRRRQRVSADH